jgi:hypothetical protein
VVISSFICLFPEVEALQEVNKLFCFRTLLKPFEAYENGQPVRTGPTNMGRKDQTPTGLFFTNWKAEETISTF